MQLGQWLSLPLSSAKEKRGINAYGVIVAQWTARDAAGRGQRAPFWPSYPVAFECRAPACAVPGPALKGPTEAGRQAARGGLF